jgi:hypothetical protein
MIENTIDCPQCTQKHMSQSPAIEYRNNYPFKCAGCGGDLTTSGSLPMIVLKEMSDGDWNFHDSFN